MYLEISIVLTWLFFFLIFCGIGFLIRRFLFNPKVFNAEDILALFWIGWAYTIFFLQLWHFLFRIDWRALLIVSFVGIAGLIYGYKDFLQALNRKPVKTLPFYLIIILTALLIANRAALTDFCVSGYWSMSTRTIKRFA